MLDNKELVKDQNFNNCPFRVTLPKVMVVDGYVNLTFSLLSKPGKRVDVVLDEIYLTDKLNRKYEMYCSGGCKREGVSQEEFDVDVEIEKKNFLLSDSTIVLYFISGDKRRYEICYTSKRDIGIRLAYVMGRKASESELERYEEEIETEYLPHEDDDNVKVIDVSGSDSVKINDFDDRLDKNSLEIIDKYKNAVLREKYYVQNEGGRKHKLTNGELIASKQGCFTYIFEMESELNLTDDAPVRLMVGSETSTGNVLVCEGFQVILVIDKSFGDTISQAFLGVEPWKLLEALADKLEQIGPHNDLTMKLLNEGPKLATNGTPDSIPKGQETAISYAKTNKITVIWGPPGTGKTYTMAQIAMNAINDGKRVLVVSHSNVSVDGVVKQTVKALRDNGMEDLLERGKVLRYGYVRDEELSQDSQAVAYNYVLEHNPVLKARSKSLHDQKEILKRFNAYKTEKGEEIEKELKKLRSEVRELEQKYANKTTFLATTISKLTVDPLFEDRKFDLVMFDEVSMAYIPQILCASMYASERLVLVGDFRQLAPIVQSEVKNTLGEDIFSFLGISDGPKVFAHPWLVMLDEQRRMHPAISKFSSKNIYLGLLKDHESVYENRKPIADRNPFPESAINLINLQGTYASAMKNSDNSRFNILSAIISFTTALLSEKSGEDSIGIITPYAAQTRLIRAMIQDHRKNDSTDIVCSTVHQFQGAERNHIIFDAVENYPSTKVGWLMGKGMDSVTRLINVAVTRARGKLTVVANVKFWERRFGSTQHIFWKLINYLLASGKEVSIKDKELSEYLEQLPETKNIRYFADYDEIIKHFQEDVKKARRNITISIPDGELKNEKQAKIFTIIEQAKNDGIEVLCKTNGYKELPDNWKSISWASDNAIFPLIIIDDTVAWYGIPEAKGTFKDDDNRSFFTVCQTYYRILGEHTIDMIKAFSDFDHREIDGLKKSLSKKINSSSLGSETDNGNRSVGLDVYIRERERCPKCKNPMMVARGRSGKCYMKCTNSKCDGSGLISKEVVNWYINMKNVTCPIHKCDIYAAVGQYGLYIKCKQGHYLKPDEI